MINPSLEDAPALCCAAESETDFMMWMSALTSVIDGSIDEQQQTTAPPEEALVQHNVPNDRNTF